MIQTNSSSMTNKLSDNANANHVYTITDDNHIIIKAPAKINLTLDVTGTRPNGYHDLQMVMQSLDLCDELDIVTNKSGDINFTMNKDLPDKIPAEQNLVYKAAALIKETYKLTCGFDIHLTKNIPAAAGLAGGSTDCAATLIGINILCMLNADTHTLCQLGVKLGADVPFCIVKGTILCEGIGEILTPLNSLSGIPVVIVKPSVSVPTKGVYQALDHIKITSRPNTSLMLSYINEYFAPEISAKTAQKKMSALNTIAVGHIAGNLSNVLEYVTIPKNPVISQIKDDLIATGAAGSLMSGSGPSTYGLFNSFSKATDSYHSLSEKYSGFDVILCKTL